jgi:hypothetical protein
MEYENTRVELRGGQSAKIVEKLLEVLVSKLEKQKGMKIDREYVFRNFRLV